LNRIDVLFVDDDEELRLANAEALELAGFAVKVCESAETALASVRSAMPHVVVSDIRMPKLDGTALFDRLQGMDADLPVILITGHGDIPQAVEAIRAGAYDFIAKPYATERLVASIRNAAEKRSLVLENRTLRAAAAAAEDDWPLIGRSPAMQSLRATLRRLAEADVDVLLEGETGVGKDLAARALHRWGRRRGRPFVTVDCAVLAEGACESELFGHEAGAFNGALRRRIGRIEEADRGILFLDDIDALPLAIQAKLLRVLEEREVRPLGTNEIRSIDFRLIVSAKTDLAQASREGRFREDLFYRLKAVRVRIPSLRDRREDLFDLFYTFLDQQSQENEKIRPLLTRSMKERLLSYDWPGNVRELEQYTRELALGPHTDPASESADELGLALAVEAYEGNFIRLSLLEKKGNVREVLHALNVPRKTFYDKVKRHGIDLASYRASG
jgi:two-component system C4-dicarboxylate transport response regulator DctD